MSNTTPDPGKPSDGTNPEAAQPDASFTDQATPDATSDEFNPDAFRDSAPADTATSDSPADTSASIGDTAAYEAPIDYSNTEEPAAAPHTAQTADTTGHGASSHEPTVLTQADLHADEVRAEESARDADTAAAPVYTDSAAPVAPSAPAAEPVTPTTPVTHDRVEPAPVRQPVYVQAPTEPKPKGNRGFGILVSLLATVVFAAIYAAVLALLLVVNNGSVDIIGDVLVKAPFWIPVIFFFVAMVLVVSVVNRGGWWAYVIGGFIVAAIVYASYLGGVLIEQAAVITPNEVAGVVQNALFSPAAVVAFVIGREVPIWFGAWVAARGRKVKERNIEARREYERILDQGPVVS